MEAEDLVVVPFSSLLMEIVDNRGKSCPFTTAGTPLIATNCIKNDNLFPTYETTKFVDTETYAQWFRGHPIPGDLIFVTKGSPGRVCIAPDPVDFCIAQDMVALRVNETKVYPRFLFALLRTRSVQEQIEQLHVGTMIPHFKKGDFDKLLLRLPSRKSQEFIGDLYFDLSFKIELNRQRNRTLEAMARALFQSWFVDFDPVKAKAAGKQPPGLKPEIAALFPDSFEESELGRVPKGWKIQSVYEIADVIYGAPFSSKQFNTIGKGIPLIRIRDLSDETPAVWTEEQHPKGYLVQPGDILVGMDGEFRTFLWGGEVCWLNQRVCAFRPKSNWSPVFLRNSISPLLAFVEATETATTVIHLGKNDIDRFKLVLPSLEIHQAFRKLSQAAYDQIVTLKQQNKTLSKMRDTLLPKLISGELRIPDAERIVARTI